MAAITFSAADRKEKVRKQVEVALAAYREMLDVFVSNRMQRAAAEAGYARPQLQGPAAQPLDTQ